MSVTVNIDFFVGGGTLTETIILDILQSAPTTTFASPPPMGNTVPNTGAFTTLAASGTLNVTGISTLTGAVVAGTSVQIGTGTRTAAATAGAVTLNKPSGLLTSEALTTAAAATYTMTLTNSGIAVGDIVLASVALGTATQGLPQVVSVTVTLHTVVFVIENADAADAFDGTIVVAFAQLK